MVDAWNMISFLSSCLGQSIGIEYEISWRFKRLGLFGVNGPLILVAWKASHRCEVCGLLPAPPSILGLRLCPSSQHRGRHGGLSPKMPHFHPNGIHAPVWFLSLSPESGLALCLACCQSDIAEAMLHDFRGQVKSSHATSALVFWNSLWEPQDAV